MIRDVPASGSLARLALVFVTVMVAISTVGMRATDDQRVLLVGQVHDPVFLANCECSTVLMRTPGLGDRRLVSDGTNLLNRTGYALAVGHVVTASRIDAIAIEGLWTFDPVDPRPMGLLNLLREYPTACLALLVILGTYGWEFLSVVLAAALAAVQFGVVAIGLDIVALQFGIGLPDSSWALTLTAAVLAGWKISQRFDTMLQGKAKAGAASLMVGLLFGDMAGMIGLIAGAVVPILSKRIALIFIIMTIASAALQVPDFTIRIMTGVVFVLACLDRLREGVASAPNSASAFTS